MVARVALLWGARRMTGREDEVDDLLVGMIGVAVGVASTIPLARYLGNRGFGMHVQKIGVHDLGDTRLLQFWSFHSATPLLTSE